MKKLLMTFGVCFFSVVLFAQHNDLTGYTGSFKFSGAPFDKIIITLEGGVLMADAEGVGKGQISATDVKDQFSQPDYEALLKFVRDDKGSITKLEVNTPGLSLLGLKQAPDFSIYVGEYTLKENSSVDKFVVLIRDGILSVDTNIGSSELAAADEKDVFHLKSVDGKVGFTRDSSGKVIGINVIAMGVSLEGSKK